MYSTMHYLRFQARNLVTRLRRLLISWPRTSRGLAWLNDDNRDHHAASVPGGVSRVASRTRAPLLLYALGSFLSLNPISSGIARMRAYRWKHFVLAPALKRYDPILAFSVRLTFTDTSKARFPPSLLAVCSNRLRSRWLVQHPSDALNEPCLPASCNPTTKPATQDRTAALV